MEKRSDSTRGVEIFVQDDEAFVNIGDNYLLRIGTCAEVDAADANRLVAMIENAIAWTRYRYIKASKGMTLH